MTQHRVYLAGGITGLSFKEASEWRDHARERLWDFSGGRIVAYDPLRFKDYLADETELADTYARNIMSSQRSIYARDRLDVSRSDLVLVNLLNAPRVSIGTVMEIAWADAWDIPCVLVMSDQGDPHDHAMIREACHWRVNDLDEALILTHRILMP